MRAIPGTDIYFFKIMALIAASAAFRDCRDVHLQFPLIWICTSVFKAASLLPYATVSSVTNNDHDSS